jgi:hypothetical protein
VAAMVGSALAGPLFVAGGVFALFAMGVLRFFEPSPSDAFADAVLEPWEPLGIVQPGAHDWLSSDFFLNNVKVHEGIGS